VQLASILGSAGLKLVPDVMLGDGHSNLADVLIARMVTAGGTSAAAVRDMPTVSSSNGKPKLS
jgi:hypothetical protein